MVSIRLEPQMEAELNNLAAQTGRSKSFYIKKAIEEFLQDKADYLMGIAVLEKQESKVGISKVRAELGLEG